MNTLLSMAPIRLRSLLFAWIAVLSMALPAAAQDNAPVLLVVGDSVSAGYGLPGGKVWVDLLAAKLKADGYRYRVVNASITGDTTAGGRARLSQLITQHKPAIVIIELGGNDALRGGKLAATRRQPRRDGQDGAGGARAGAHRRDAAAAELRPRLREGVQRPLRERREDAQGAARPVLLRRASARTSRTSSPTASIRRRTRSRGCSTTYGRRSCPCSSGEAAGTRGRRRQGRHRRAGRASGAHRRAQPVRVRARPHSRRDQPAGARRHAARGNRHAARPRIRVRRQAARRRDRRAQHRAHHRGALRRQAARLGAARVLLARRQAQRRAHARAAADRLARGAARGRLPDVATPRRRRARRRCRRAFATSSSAASPGRARAGC